MAMWKIDWGTAKDPEIQQNYNYMLGITLTDEDRTVNQTIPALNKLWLNRSTILEITQVKATEAQLKERIMSTVMVIIHQTLHVWLCSNHSALINLSSNNHMSFLLLFSFLYSWGNKQKQLILNDFLWSYK